MYKLAALLLAFGVTVVALVLGNVNCRVVRPRSAIRTVYYRSNGPIGPGFGRA